MASSKKSKNNQVQLKILQVFRIQDGKKGLLFYCRVGLLSPSHLNNMLIVNRLYKKEEES